MHLPSNPDFNNISGTMSIFLAAFPNGATKVSVSSYARDQLKMEESDVIATFQSCPTVFKAVEGSKWKLIAFD